LKKVFLSLLVTWALALGVVTATGERAAAACPYSGCINTTTTVSVPAKVTPRLRARIKVTVSTPGNVTPYGTLTVTVYRHGAVKYHATVPYPGGLVAFSTKRLRKGRYLVTVVFTPPVTSVFTGSSSSARFKVKKRRHH
jgi:hypothetical protein